MPTLRVVETTDYEAATAVFDYWAALNCGSTPRRELYPLVGLAMWRAKTKDIWSDEMENWVKEVMRAHSTRDRD